MPTFPLSRPWISITFPGSARGARLCARERPGFFVPTDPGAACALAALDALAARFPVTQADVREGLLSGVIPGRFQVLPGRPVCVLDVAHNAQAARSLAATLKQQRVEGRELAGI